MKNQLKQKLDNLPSSPGVYRFKDKKGKIIYVGKAKSLRHRVRSYFSAKPLSPRIEKMISLIDDFDVINTDNEVESLILEMNLIKELKPRYNVNLKDDKSYPYIVITNELFPRVFPTRKRRNDGSKYFGPYTDVGSMKYSLKMLRDIFMIRTCNYNITEETIQKKKYKLCLEYHIKKCEGPCEGLVSASRYNEMISEVEKLLNGKTASLIKQLEEKMKLASHIQNFEEAALIRNKIQSLEVYSSKQKMVSEDFEDRDVIGFVKEEDDACVMVMNIRDGKVVGKRHFYLDNIEDKTGGEIIERVLFKYYSENVFIPKEIDLEQDVDKEVIEKWFLKQFGKKVDVVIPKRGDKVKLISLVKANARFMLDELKLQRLKREFIPHSVTALKRDLRLAKLPRRIECFDISHIQGTDTVGSMVVFYDGRPRKSDYRKFKIRMVYDETGKPDDFASIREIVYRRYKPVSADEGSSETVLPFPDLIVIDGGKGQLSSAVKVLSDLGYEKYSIIGLAKRLEEVFLPDESVPHNLPKTSSGLKLLQRIRDEAHRFAVTYHRSLRDKRTLTSELEQIKGIGKKTAQKLLNVFGSAEAIKNKVLNNYEEFEVKTGKSKAQLILNYYKNNV